MRHCLIFLDEEALRDSLDLLEVARQIHATDDYVTTGVTFGPDFELAMGAFDSIIQVRHEKIQSFDPLALTEALVELQQTRRFDTILVPATPLGRMLAPRLAMRLKTGLVADVTAIRHEGDQLLAIRPAYSGRIMAAIAFIGDGPIMMSIRPGVFHWNPQSGKNTQTEIVIPGNVRDGKIRQLAVKSKGRTYDIRESDVLVSGGGGMIGHFQELERLAKVMGGQVSASRKIVDHGLAPRSIQVGQSGKTVSPKLYLAMGINGAVQHVEGLKQVKNIISVNLNKNAPICSLSDIVVEGDALTFIDKLVDKIEQEATT